MTGREDKKANDLFYLCSLIAYIARKTKNKPAVIADALGTKYLTKIYELADVYHCDNIDDVSDGFIEKCRIETGIFDNVSACKYSVPTHWDIGKVYKRLILMVSARRQTDPIDVLRDVYHSHVCDLIEDYNGSFYYENPQTICDIYLTGIVY